MHVHVHGDAFDGLDGSAISAEAHVRAHICVSMSAYIC